MTPRIEIPASCLVLMVGPPGAGKTTLARRLFAPTEVLSADAYRAAISDDEENQACSDEAFRILSEVARARLNHRRVAVVDACNLGEGNRRKLHDLARECRVQTAAIVLDLPARACAARAAARAERSLPADVVYKLHAKFAQETRPKVLREKFYFRYVLTTPQEVEAAVLVRRPLPVNRRELAGPFDIVGDVHGCIDELTDLLTRLGYEILKDDQSRSFLSHPGGRTAVFVGDLVDRGPDTPGVLELVMNSARRGSALCILGNHDEKCARALQGRKVLIHEGLQRSLDQIGPRGEDFRAKVVEFISGLPSHLVLDGGRLVVAHAGLPKEMHGRDTDEVTQIAKYGVTTGEHDAHGHAVRADWAADYRGEALVVYGHVVEAEVRHSNNTYCIDTGCVFGHRLTALRYPERELVSVEARRQYIHPDFEFQGLRGPQEAMP